MAVIIQAETVVDKEDLAVTQWVGEVALAGTQEWEGMGVAIKIAFLQEVLVVEVVEVVVVGQG